MAALSSSSLDEPLAEALAAWPVGAAGVVVVRGDGPLATRITAAADDLRAAAGVVVREA